LHVFALSTPRLQGAVLSAEHSFARHWNQATLPVHELVEDLQQPAFIPFEERHVAAQD
jgi:hypothetical protein